jgi:hypothetical protein
MPTPSANTPNSEIEQLKVSILQINAFMMGLVFVSIFGFIAVGIGLCGVMIDASREKQASYQQLITKIDENNHKFDVILEKISSQE